MLFATEVRTFTCICCPLGCLVEVSFDEAGDISDIEGYTCARGRDYALRESTAPERMVTAVLAVEGSLEPLSVKTESPVPKDQVGEVLSACAAARLIAPVAAGDVVIADVCGTGVSVVATKSVP